MLDGELYAVLLGGVLGQIERRRIARHPGQEEDDDQEPEQRYGRVQRALEDEAGHASQAPRAPVRKMHGEDSVSPCREPAVSSS